MLIEVDHSAPSSAEVKNARSYTSTIPYISMVWCLVKYRDNFTSSITQHKALCGVIMEVLTNILVLFWRNLLPPS